MKKLTIEDIRALSPCYDPKKFLPKDWTGTIIDVLNVVDCPAKDRLWTVVRSEFLTDRQLHEYALAVAKMCEKNSADERVKACNDLTEKYLAGKATKVELESARSAAWSAAQSAAQSAAWSAAESAAQSAAWSAQSAAESAARSAENQQIQILLKILSEKS